MRVSVSQWSSQGSEVMMAASPSQPGPSTSGAVGPTIGPSIGPVRVSELRRVTMERSDYCFYICTKSSAYC